MKELKIDCCIICGLDENKKTVFQIHDHTSSENNENFITITNVVKSDVPHGKTVSHESEKGT